MQLSKNFYLREFTKSQTALRRGIDNKPGRKEIWNLEQLCHHVLQPVRDHFGPVIITSGYRSLTLNRAIGSSDTSQHIKGQAADIEVFGVSNYDLAVWISRNTPHDQVILEMFDRADPQSGWVHVSHVSNRGEALTYYTSGHFVAGLHSD